MGARYVWCRRSLWFPFSFLLFIEKFNVVIFCLCWVFSFSCFPYELSFWTLTVVAVLSFESPRRHRNSFPGTLFSVSWFICSASVWEREHAACFHGFHLKFFPELLSVWIALFLMVFHFVFDYYATVTLHNRWERNNEVGLSHQDGGSIAAQKPHGW